MTIVRGWDDDGQPLTMEAATADALEWLLVMERLVDAGHWKFSLPESRDKLRRCREHLERKLDEAGVS